MSENDTNNQAYGMIYEPATSTDLKKIIKQQDEEIVRLRDVLKNQKADWLDDAAKRIAMGLVPNNPFDWKMGAGGNDKMNLAEWVARQSYGYAKALWAEKLKIEKEAADKENGGK